MSEQREVKYWFTTKTGKHIPVFEGESKEDALKRSVGSKSKSEAKQDKAKKQKEWEKKEDKRLSSMNTDERLDDVIGELEYLKAKGNKMTDTDREMYDKYMQEKEELQAIQRKNNQINYNKVEAEKLNKESSTQSQHKRAIEELSDSKYEDGTYDITTKKTKEFSNGYQVTFCQIGDNYSDAEYQIKVNECLRLSSDGKTYAGKFESTPEISFHCSDKQKAIEYAKANNQISIWDWENMLEIKTGGTGRRK